MKLDQAIEMIHKLHKENLSNVEIANRLEKSGYKSERTGKPIGSLAVGYHLKKNLPPDRPSKAKEPPTMNVSTGPKPTPTVPQHRRQAKNPTESKLELVQAFLASKDIALKDKCEIAATILLS